MLTRNALRLLATTFLGGSLLAGCTTIESDLTADIASTQAPLIQAENPVSGEYIVVLKSDRASVASVSTLANRVNLRGDESQVKHTYSVIPGFSARLSDDAVRELRSDPSVAYLEVNGEVSIDTVHSTNGAEGIDRIDQRELPLNSEYDDYGNTGAGVQVFIVDTGIHSGHNEFAGRVGTMTDFVGGNGEDCHGHGTHVASTAAGTLYGVAKGATVHGVRVLNCQGSGTFAGVIAGVDHVASACASANTDCVANMSLGGGFSQAVNDAVANAVAAGVPFAVAAGNESTDACTRSPASEPSALTVAAMDDNTDARASFSNFGSCIDLFAPGVNIKAGWIGGSDATNTISGTSMASPHVAGVAALYLGANPGADPAEVEQGIEGAAGLNCVSNPSGSPNLLLHNNFDAEPFQCGDDPGDPGDPPADSCVGYCGGQTPSGCQCDLWCLFFGDCCPDMLPVCYM